MAIKIELTNCNNPVSKQTGANGVATVGESRQQHPVVGQRVVPLDARQSSTYRICRCLMTS